MTPSSTTWRPSPLSIPVTYTLRVTRALHLVAAPCFRLRPICDRFSAVGV